MAEIVGGGPKSPPRACLSRNLHLDRARPHTAPASIAKPLARIPPLEVPAPVPVTVPVSQPASVVEMPVTSSPQESVDMLPLAPSVPGDILVGDRVCVIMNNERCLGMYYKNE